jgi:ribosome-associated toxin RatA of RatAB toxin-antitoxin module
MRWYLLAVLVVSRSAAAADGGWQPVAHRDGIVVERRAVDGSSIGEIRATAHSPLPPAAVMATVWKHDEYVQFIPYVKRLDVLRDDGDTKLIYEQVHLRFVKDRDVVARVTRTFEPATGAYEITGIAVPDEGPPANRGCVRVRTSASRWRLVPAAGGGTEVTYTNRTDVGGLLPAWVVNAVQKDATAALLRAMLDRAQQKHP